MMRGGVICLQYPYTTGRGVPAKEYPHQIKNLTCLTLWYLDGASYQENFVIK